VLTPGMGAVSTTFMAGVELVRKGVALPIGSVTQLGTIRLGKRTQRRSPLIREFVPLEKLDNLVFGGWDIFPDTAYEAAVKAGVQRLVMVWCGSTEVFQPQHEVHADPARFENAMKTNHPAIAPSMLYAWAAITSGVPFANGAPNLTADIPALQELAREHNVPL